MLALLITITASAAPLHTGIPVEGIEGLSAPIFQTSSTGWWAQIPRGTVQVYVGPSDTEAIAWVEKMKEKMVKYRPAPNEEYLALSQADEALGDGIGLLIVRDDNISFMVRHDGQAQDWAQSIHSSIVDIPVPLLEPATLQKDGDEWTVVHPEEVVHMAFRGGETAASPQLRFSKLPEYVVIWDGWGRAVTTPLMTADQREAATPIP